jgi:hypothetical protein
MKRRRQFLIVLLVSCSLLAAAYLTYGMQRGWTDSLQKAVQGSTRLRIRSGGTCHRRIEREKTLAEITDAGEINRFIHGIVINGRRSGGACMCCGDPTFEFYAGDRLLAMVGYHHGERLRWAGGKWTGDGELTGPSRDFLLTWLSQHGVDGPRRKVQEMQNQQDERIRREQRFAELISPDMLRAAGEAARKVPPNTERREEKRAQAIADAFMEHEGDGQTSIELYLRVLGVTGGTGDWTYYDWQCPVARYALPRFKGPELAQAAQAVMTDDEGRIGAARWFFGEGGWRNLDELDRERILPPLARRALQHPHAGSRKIAMLGLTEINSVWVTELLRGTLSRPTDPNWTRPEAKPWYGHKIDLATGEQIYEGECSDAVWAAFCLAKMGSIESLPAIQKLADESQGPDRDLLDKAIQLLRDKSEKTPADPK